MTLKYDELMDRIEVTPEMRQRILKNIETADLTPDKKVLRLHHLKQYLAAAACFALLITGIYTLPQRRPESAAPGSAVTSPVNGIEEATSLEELSQTLCFAVPDLTGLLPFVPEDVIYSAYCGEMAQVEYTCGEQKVLFRMAAGEQDVSGDYTDYPNTEALTLDDGTATLKGENNVFTLAIWSRGGYSYALSLTNGLDTEQWQTLLCKIS